MQKKYIKSRITMLKVSVIFRSYRLHLKVKESKSYKPVQELNKKNFKRYYVKFILCMSKARYKAIYTELLKSQLKRTNKII
jgi:hypothetical protein